MSVLFSLSPHLASVMAHGDQLLDTTEWLRGLLKGISYCPQGKRKYIQALDV